MQKTEISRKKYVFVCGLHRSGTTVLARDIGKLENCTAFDKTGAVMDEGQFLQSVYPPDDDYGGVGLFAFDERAHLTETSHLLTIENATRLRQSWHAHWDRSKGICVEKTPGNLIMSRFLQEVFEDCYFIVIRRHPIPVSLATQKWSLTPLHSLFDHWLCCHELFENDKKHLKYVYELTYEEYTQDPVKHLAQIAAFIGTRPAERSSESVTDTHDKKYFDRWNNLLTDSSMRGYYRYIAKQYGAKFSRYGYSLAEGEQWAVRGGEVGYIAGAFYCLLANVQARWWRLGESFKGGLKVMLPGVAVAKIKAMRGRIDRKQSELINRRHYDCDET